MISMQEWEYFLASFPSSPTSECEHWSCAGVESVVSFLTWASCNQKRTEFSEQKGNVFCVVHPIILNTRCVGCLLLASWICEVSHPPPSPFLLFLGLRVRPCTIKVSLLPLTLLTWEKGPGSLQLQCLHSGVGEPANEAKYFHVRGQEVTWLYVYRVDWVYRYAV